MTAHPCRLFLFAFLALPPSHSVAGAPAEVRTDAYGDPLPAEARFRLVTIRLRHDTGATKVAFSPDGKVLASAGFDATVRLWRLADGKELHRLEGHPFDVRCVAFAPDGRLLASAGQQGQV